MYCSWSVLKRAFQPKKHPGLCSQVEGCHTCRRKLNLTWHPHVTTGSVIKGSLLGVSGPGISGFLISWLKN